MKRYSAPNSARAVALIKLTKAVTAGVAATLLYNNYPYSANIAMMVGAAIVETITAYSDKHDPDSPL